MNRWLVLGFLLALTALAYADGNTAENQKNQPEMGDAYVSPTNGLGSWIWEDKTLDDQTCQLWNTIDIPNSSKVTRARLVMTVDNEFALCLDGHEIGRGAEWRELFIFDLTQLLTPGRHVLAVNCYNGSFFAGMLFGLQVDLSDGKHIEIKSDQSWKVVPEGVSHWETRTEAQPDWLAASIKAPLGGSPWWTAPDAVNLMPSLQPIKVYFWQTGWFQISLLTLCGLVILVSLRLMTQLAMHQKERFLLRRERARIARDIHDDIGARMTQLVLHGEVAQNELPADAEMRQHLNWICEEARGLLSTMDEILWAVNPRRDTLRDFTDYVCKYAEDFLAPTKIQCFFGVGPEISAEGFDLPLRRSLLMAVKESLNNAAKHSGATELSLQIHWRDKQLVVVVRDNGKGFDPKLANSGRNGLPNMAERMTELGGHCVVSSQPGQGCQVEFIVPLHHRRSNFWGWIWNEHSFPAFISGIRDDRTGESAQSHDPTKY
jgi:signal transduction histidine kinase